MIPEMKTIKGWSDSGAAGNLATMTKIEAAESGAFSARRNAEMRAERSVTHSTYSP